MSTELLDIQPRELKFTFELKKQSSCLIQLRNMSDHYVAFKVKTTSPKKYCVRPNIGVIEPRATCDIAVTMQAQRVAPSDLQCKDKFLIQSTVVPMGMVEEEITSDMFARDSGKYIEDKKLRVVLVSAPCFPVLLPVNGELKQDPWYESSAQKDRSLNGSLNGVENIPPPSNKVMEDVKGLETVKDIDELGATKVVDELRAANDMDKSRASKDVEQFENAKDTDGSGAIDDMNESRAVGDMGRFEGIDVLRAIENMDVLRVAENVNELREAKNVDSAMCKEKPKLAEDFQDLKSKHSVMDTKLREAELTIRKLIEERGMTTREKDNLKHELELLRKDGVRRIQVGFPFLYVCMVALVSVTVGYLIHS